MISPLKLELEVIIDNPKKNFQTDFSVGVGIQFSFLPSRISYKGRIEGNKVYSEEDTLVRNPNSFSIVINFCTSYSA